MKPSFITENAAWTSHLIIKDNTQFKQGSLTSDKISNPAMQGQVKLATLIENDSILLRYDNGTCACFHVDAMNCQNCSSVSPPSDLCQDLRAVLVSDTYATATGMVGYDSRTLMIATNNELNYLI